MKLGHQLSEIYKDKAYEPYLDGKENLTILDIGGNIGMTSMYFSKFAKRVITLEPSMEHFNILLQNLQFNRIENVTPVMKALFIDNSQLNFYHNDNRTCYSLHTAVDNKSKPERVQCVKIDDLLKEYEIETVDFMKIDVEGSETEILSSDSFKSVADKFKVIMGEYHDWSGRHPNQIKDALELNGFNFEWLKSEAHLFVARR